MQFPLEGRSGNGIPLWGREMGCSFPKRSFRENVPLWSRILGCTFPDELKGESASHSEHFRGTLRYLRSHISANEINLASPLLAAVS